MLACVRKFLCLLMMAVLCLQCAPFTVVSAQEIGYTGEAYEDLPTEEMRTVYRILEEGIAGLSPVIALNSVEIYYAELMDVIRAVCVDHPDYFWFLEQGIVNYTGATTKSNVSSFEPEYILNGKSINAGSQELIDAMYAFHTKVQEIVNGIPVNCTTDYEIALYLHDYLAEHVTYTLEGEHPSAYAAIILGEAACYGYSKAYQCLLNAAGIRARTITGDSDNGEGNLMGHAWNLVWLDGDCYYVDVTWDDLDDLISHSCFAISLTKISKDHYADPEFILPDCSHTCLDHYTLSQGPGNIRATTSTTAEELAACFQFNGIGADGAEFVCEINFPNGVFWNWFDRLYNNLRGKLGLSVDTEVYYYQMYNAYYLIMVDPNYDQDMPAVQSIELDAAEITLTGIGMRYQLKPQIQAESCWTPELSYSSSDEFVATVNDQGIITAVGEGTAVITAQSAQGDVSAACSVTVSAGPEHTHSMRYFGEAEPSCTQDGHGAYYLCTSCGCRFADENGSVMYTQTAEYVIPASHNRLLYISKEGYHMRHCKCGADLPETKEAHTDADGDGKCDVCHFSLEGSSIKDKDEHRQKDNGKGWITVVVIAALVGGGAALYFVIRKRRWGY